MKFFMYNQNNSGGSFDFDEDTGITHYVIVEAESGREADAKFEGIGGYFDGCENGGDCPCCGDRWYPAEGEPVATAFERNRLMPWMPAGKECAVHYADGRVEWFGFSEREEADA